MLILPAMKISRWNRLRSYLHDVLVESSSSDYNDHLDVLISRGRYQLCTANAIYSYGDLYDNYYKSFKILLAEGKTWPNALVLGLGLGSIPQMLENNFHQKMKFACVEIDDEVIRLAQNYVLHELSSPIEIFTADAFSFVQLHDHKYDLICIDLFVDDIIPNKFQTVDFLRQTAGLLHKEGLIMYNRLARTEKDVERTTDFYNNTFKKAFPQARYLDVQGNWMLLSH